MSYVNNQIIECLRASSTEKKSDNNENLAQFTNKLSQAVKLDVGDTISIERAFINGLGAGNQNTIQFSGRRVKPTKNRVQKYTKIEPKVYQNSTLVSPYRLDYYLNYNVSEVETEPLEIRDNEVSLIIGYYFNSCNHPSYLQLPRRFASQFYGQSSTRENWTTDDTPASGLPLENQGVDQGAFCFADWKFFRSGAKDELKLKIDNSRYTLFLRDKVFYAKETTDSRTDPATVTPVPDAVLSTVDPYFVSKATYHRYRERKIIKVDKGFNTAQSVANQMKLQLNQSEPQQTFEIADPTDKIQKHALTTTIAAETYKPFNVASMSEFSSQNWDDFSRLDTIPQTNNMYTYDSQFYAIGVKRPEIWEAGRDDAALGVFTTSVYITIDKADRDTATIVTDSYWTPENLQYYKKLFISQKLYPELWDDLDKLPDYQTLDRATLNKLKPSSSAFLHMSRYGNSTSDPTKVPFPVEHFGQDGLARVTSLYNSATAPQFLNYDETQTDFDFDPLLLVPEINERWDPEKYVFGFAVPYYEASIDKYFISLKTDEVGGIPATFFTGTTAGVADKIWGTADLNDPGRFIGYDKSWTAYGTACMLPYSSHTEFSFEGQETTTGDQHWVEGVKERRTDNIIATLPYMTQAYLGANNPIIDYNSETNRFEISQLHIAENVGNSYNAGDMGGESIIPPPINADGGDVVYKVNPRVGYDGFSPSFKPYKVNTQIQFADPDGPNSISDMDTWENTATKPTKGQLNEGLAINARDISLPNEHIEPYKIFDAWGGIYFDDMGYNFDEWDNSSLWGRMGFTWDQFNSPPKPENMLDQRISEENKYDLYRATTNSIVDTTDTKAFVVNLYGAPLYSTMLGSVKTILPKIWQAPISGPIYPHCVFSDGQKATYYPALTQRTSSFALTARNLPKVQLNPFYTIRSDIIGYTEYLGSDEGGMRLPVVGIVDRYGAQGDFYFGSPSDLSFTVTRQTILSDIQTAICNPDGTFADVDNDCGVLYKIQRSMPAPQNIFQQIIDQETKK